MFGNGFQLADEFDHFNRGFAYDDYGDQYGYPVALGARPFTGADTSW